METTWLARIIGLVIGGAAIAATAMAESGDA